MLHMVRKTELDSLFMCIVPLRLAPKWTPRFFAVVLLVMVSLPILIYSSPAKLMLCFVLSIIDSFLSSFSFNKFNFIIALMSLMQHSSLSRYCLSFPGTVGLSPNNFVEHPRSSGKILHVYDTDLLEVMYIE